MAEPEAEGEEAPKKKSKLPILIGLVLMLLLGGGAFYAVYSGMILAPAHQDGAEAAAEDGSNTASVLPSNSSIWVWRSAEPWSR